MLVTNDTVLAIQLTKILHDSKAAFAVEDSCLVAKPVYFQNCNIFKRDLILNTRPGIPMKSCLLDEGFNKGIYIDLSDVGQRGTLFIRLPDAKMINLMTKNLPSGELVYPRIAELASRILQVCMEGRGMNQLVGNLRKYNETGRVGGLIARYMTEVKQLLNTRENYMKTLIQPVSGGIAPKQMADKYVPEGVCVVLNDRIHETLRRKTWGDLEVTPDTFLVMGLRNPVLWQAQVTPLVVWSKDQWSEYLLSRHGIELDDYLVVEYCQHLLLMNIMDVLASQADCDGDLYPISVIPGEAAQAEFGALFDERTVQIRISEHKTIEGRVRVLPNVHTEELNWIFGKDMGDGTFMDGYTQGEVNSDAKLYDHETGTYKELPKYKLNSAVFSWEQKDEALPYNKLLSNAVTAKGKVATGTLELWHINSGTEIFRHYYYKQIEELGGYKACSKRRDTIAGIMANNGVLEPFSHADWGLMSHMYSRIVQDFIVRGIKHNSNGSSGADIFLLENTTAEGSANTMAEAKRALQALGYSREQVNKLMFMIRWLKAEGYLDALILYVRFYNRGTLPSEKNMEEFAQQFNDIVALTINGRIMSPYSDIINQITDFQGHVVAVKGSAKVAGAPVVNAGVMSFSGNGMKVA